MDRQPSEIEKLTDRISKDPKSKLFVPLAEEYKKAGDVEMAVLVLTEGLKHNPGYVTAKSFLGRLLLEKGDLGGAKKEFEEVVKAIPDNLLAHRKLGDIYALQGDNSNALKHLRSALALNSADEDIRSLVSDLEAGKPVKDRIQKQAQKPPAEQKPAPALAVNKPAPPQAKAAAAPPPSAPHHVREQEEAEEILLVEPLDAHAAVLPMARGGSELLREHPGPAVEPSVGHAAEEGSVFQLSGQYHEPEGSPGPARPAGMPGISSGQEIAARAGTDDDLTTNTLAELYVSQGFYDKAIDIYDRLLADNPGNRALQEKLKSLRAMAGAAASAAIPEGGAGQPYAVPEEEALPAFGAGVGQEYVPPPPEAVFGAPTEEQPLFGAGPVPGAGGPREFSPPTTEAPPFGETSPFGEGFTPVEYHPPAMSPEPDLTGPMAPGASQPSTGRKKTIDKLEMWLKNIMKEKGR